MLWQSLMLAAIGFVLGGVLFSWHLPLWLRGVDTVAASADHNPGTANAMKLAGVPVGMLCLLCDMLKGYLPVWWAFRLGGMENPLLLLVMAAPVAGHALALAYPFRGGKCIATAFGVLLAFMPASLAAAVLAFWYIFFSVALVIHPNERRSVVTFVAFSVSILLGAALWTHRFFLACGCLLVAGMAIQRNYISLKEMERGDKDAPAVAEPAAEPVPAPHRAR